MADIREFFKALEADPKAKAKLKGMQEPGTAEEAAEQYLAIAQDMGIAVSREDMTAFLKAKEQAQREKAAKAEEKVKEALDEDALENVAGGQKIGGCESTADIGEWCWFSDSCAVLINDYNYVNDVKSEASDDLFEDDEQEFNVDQILNGEHFGAGRNDPSW